MTCNDIRPNIVNLIYVKIFFSGPRDAYRVVQTPMPQNTKLSRCYSEFIASSYNESSVQKSSSQFGISNDLMEVLAQESVEFI